MGDFPAWNPNKQLFDQSQMSNPYSLYAGQALPWPTTYDVSAGPPTDAMGNPLASYKPPQPTQQWVPGTTINSGGGGGYVGHEPGKGRHKGRLGALLAELPNGVKFAVGTGLSDAERASPPPVGSMITFRYQELTDGGVPRFPSYVGVRALAASGAFKLPLSTGDTTMAKASTSLRRFEFVGGGSDKFWEIQANGTEVTVRFGRNGTAGQTNTKSFPDAAAAQKHADKLIQEKTGKGYVEAH